MPSTKKHSITLGRAMKLTRVAVSVILFLTVTTLFTTLTSKVAVALDWVAHIQVFPLALAGAAGGLMAWFGLTLLLGRVYCSSVCPMGVLQDVFSHLHRFAGRGRRRHPFRYSMPRNRFRYAFLCVVAGAVVLGAGVVPTLFDPYSAYGRVASEIWRPVWQFVCRSPVFFATRHAFAKAVVTFLAVGMVSYRHGRLICNTVCPVGSTLGIFSRYSLFHFDIDTDVCVNCRKCESVCKAECISMADHVVDGSRCVACFNCVEACDSKAIRYTWRRKKLALPMMQRIGSAAAAPLAGSSEAPVIKDDAGGVGSDAVSRPAGIDRRRFLATGLIVAAAPAVGALARATGGDVQRATVEGGHNARAVRPVAPPGRRNMADFLERCTGCGLCVAQCPSQVLRPSVNEYGWLNVLHPVLDYKRSYCRYDCTICSDVCPTGALLPLTRDEKHIFIIGHASVDASACVGCGRCARRCPRKAIAMEPRDSSTHGNRAQMAARVDTSLCIGCGACEYVCPVKPVKAVMVNGIV